MYRRHLCDYGNNDGKILTEAYSEPRNLLTANYFCKKLYLRCLTGFWTHFWLTVTFIKFRFLKDSAYEESKRYYESNDYSSDEEENVLEDINGKLVCIFSKEYFC